MKKVLRKAMSLMLAMTLAIPSITPVLGAEGDGVHGGANVGDTLNVHTLGGDWLTYGTNNGKPFSSKFDVSELTSHLGNDYNVMVYCIDPNKPGVSSVGDYDVVLSAFDDEKLSGIIYNGYPRLSPEELGLSNASEAYYATKMAVDTHLNGLDINKWTPTAGAENASAVVTAIKKIYNDGINFNISSLPKSEFKVEEVSANVDRNEFIMKVTTNAKNYSDVSLSLSGADKPSDAKITDMSGNEKSTFKVDEEFKVIFTKPEGEYTGKSFNVDVDGTIQDYSKVLQGTPADPTYQRYAVIPQWIGSPTNGVITYDNETVPVEPPTGGSSKLKIKKLESGTTKGLAGAIFKVTSLSSGVLGTYTSDSNGEINLDVEDGNYIIEEITPPTGYVLSSKTKQEVKVISTDEVDSIVTFENLKKPSLTVKKVDGKTGLPLANATIRVALDGGSNFIDVKTDSTGTAKIDVLDAGTYFVTEIVAPNGYLLNETPYPIKLENGKDSTITIDNFTEPSITVLKVDEATGLPLELAEFSIAEKGGSIVNEGLTEKDGTITTTELKGGIWYTITELQAPTNYFRTQISKDVYLEKGQHLTVKFDNRLKPSLSIKKIDSETGLPLAGATFKVTSTEGKTIGEFTTDKDGKILIEYLDEGIYSVEEIMSPSGYVLNPQHKDIKLEWTNKVGSNVSELVFDNKVKPSIEVTKIDGLTNAPLKNATIRVSLNGSTEYVELTTDVNGKAIFTDLQDGTYIVTETVAPSGYLLNKTEYVVKVVDGKATPITIPNYKEPTLIVVKYDEATGLTLPLAEFSLAEKDGVVVNEGVTDSNGIFTTTGLIEGWYTISELAPPQNYFITTPTKDVYLKQGETLTVKVDNRLKPSLEISKIDGESGNKLSGATFKVEKEDGSFSSEFTTDANGKILLENIEEGVYTVTEIKAPTGYVINSTPKTIHLKWQSDNTFVHSLVFENYTKPSLIVEKYDEMTNELLPNAQFRIEGVDNNFLWEGVLSKGNLTSGSTQTINGSLEDGRLVINGLDEGTYKITELNPPNGYTFSDTTINPRTVVIEKNKTTTVKIDNRPLPDLEILKIDSITKEPLKNATFEIRNADGEFVTERQTDENGKINLTNIPEGTYTITEKSAPTNYILESSNTKTIQIKWNGGDNKDGQYNLIFENTLKPTLVINKTSGLGGFGLAGAKFEVKYRQDDGGFKTLGTYTTNIKGQIVLPYVNAGWYQITEIKAPNGYQLPSNPTKEVYLNAGENSYSDIDAPTNVNDGDITVSNGNLKVTYGAEISEIASLFSSENSTVYASSIDFDNYPLNSIVIKKTDALTGKLLDGATFELIKVAENVSGSQGTTIGTYTTDYTGVIVITGLTSGHYIVRESKAPLNYDLNVNNQQQAYLAEDGTSIVELMFSNYPYGRLVINKMDTDTKEPLKGATFEVTNSKGEYIGTSGNGHYTTDVEGSITLDNLPPDSYVVTEIKAPTNYAIDQENNVKVVEIGYGDTKEVDFYNQAYSSLVIRKLDTDTKEPLKGAEFKINNSDGTVVGNSNGIFTTDEDGLITITNLPIDTYVVTETKAPTNYILSDNTQTVEVRGNSTHTLAFYNTKMSSAQIIKIDSVTKAPLKDAQFKVYKANGELVGTYTTDGDGLIILPNLSNGWYKAIESKAPVGYQIDDTAQDFEIKGNQFVKLTFENKKLTALIIKKVKDTDGSPLAGAEFKVTKQNGELVGTYTTDNTGTITIPTLTPDWYVISETKAPSGYILDETPKTVEVKTNVPTEVTFTNKLKSGFQIIKTDSVTGEPLSGATFTVYKKTGDVVGTYTTDKNGVIIIDGLDNGWYKIAETKAPIGYQIDETPKDVEMKGDEFHKITFTNTKLASLIIKKVKDTDGSPLAGAEFKVTKQNGELVGTYTTDNTGTITIPTLTPNWYVVSETKAPAGYILNETPKTVEVKTNVPTEVTFTNKLKSGFQIIKIDSITGEPLSGAVFTVYKKTGDVVGTYTTDENGVIIIDGLDNGWYKIAETKAPIGYKIDETPKDVEMKGDEFHKITFANTPMGGLKIIKLNSNTREPIKGVEFEISHMNGEKVLNESNGTKFITDSTGQIYLPNLVDGTYTVTETKQADGYFIDPSPKNVIIKAGKPTILEVENTPASGLVIYKTDERTNKPLKGVEFDVLRADGSRVTSNILDKNQSYTENNSPNKTINGNGAVSGSYTTDENGRIYLNHLPVGEYHIVETKALDGYELDKTVHAVTVREGKQETIKITNKQKAGLRIHKIDKFTRQGIYNVEFMVFDSNNKVIGNFYSDNNGYVDFDGILSEGRYTIRETRPASGYFEDNIPKTVEFKAGQTTVIEWENTPQKGQIQIEKLSKDYNSTNGFNANTPLDGAIFDIYEYRTGNLVERVESINGVAKSSALPIGRYKVKEVKAPDFYSLSNEVFDIDVEFAGQIVKLTAYNESIKTNVSIKKTGIKQTSVGQDIKYNITNVANNGTVALNNFYWKDFIPTNAIRTTKIVTGTYNVQQNYKIVATTNTGKEINVNDNLSTTQNYTIELNNSALGLAQNEYVVSVTLMFGVVPPNFRMVEQASVYGTVLKSLPHNYVFTNRVEVGGTYNNNWQKSSSTWSTTVYNPSKLPKTGF